VPEPDDAPEPGDDDPEDEPEPQPAVARAAVSTTAPSMPGLAARLGKWNRRLNNVSLAAREAECLAVSS
jgi:hypothetical protein